MSLTDLQQRLVRNQIDNTLGTLAKLDGKKKAWVLFVVTPEGDSSEVDVMFNFLKEDALRIVKEYIMRNTQ